MADADFPTSFPIFPLPEVVLFPRVKLPLHIFEPRYRRMTEDALAGSRLIGMTLLRNGARTDQGESPVFSIGCVGRVSQHARLADGRLNLILDGVSRFRIQSETRAGLPYRRVEAELLADAELDQIGQRGLAALRSKIEIEICAQLRSRAPEAAPPAEARLRQLSDEELVHAIGFGLDIPAVEKQSLLEASDLRQRAQLLLDLLRMRSLEQQHPETPRTLN